MSFFRWLVGLDEEALTLQVRLQDNLEWPHAVALPAQQTSISVFPRSVAWRLASEDPGAS